MAFVLPAELLQVKFSEELRNYLTTVFQRTEIFTFNDLLFDCKGQDTVLLIGFKKHVTPGQFYTHISNIEQLENNNFTLVENYALVSTKTKWTHHSLSSDELTFIHNIADRLKSIDTYCDSKPGIVTAANDFFIVDEKTEDQFTLASYTRPIILKGMYVNGSVVYDRNEYESLLSEGKPAKILVFNDNDKGRVPTRVQQYLDMGEVLPFSTGYKCSKRKNWFVIPNISTIPQAFFLRRTHHYPKLLKNAANVLVTDTAYKIEMKNGHQINDLIYSFYNSLTLAFAELDGRYYGGGVLELTPQEFKNLPVPNVSITETQFADYADSFQSKNDIIDVLDENEFYILNMSLNLNAEEIMRIRAIYQKLVSKRFRKK